MRDLNHIAYVRGDRLFKQGRFANAAKWFQAALDEWPEDWQALWALADCFSEMGKPRKADAYFRQALLLAPENEEANLLFNIGNALFDQGRYIEAIAQYSQIPSGHQVAGKAAKNIALAQQRLGTGANHPVKARPALTGRRPYLPRYPSCPQVL